MENNISRERSVFSCHLEEAFHKVLQSVPISSADFGHFGTVLKRLEGGHRLDAALPRRFFKIVHVDLEEGNLRVLFRELLEELFFV